MLEMSNPVGMERLVVGEVEEEKLVQGVPLDAAGRIGAFGFFIACLPRYSKFLEDDMICQSRL